MESLSATNSVEAAQKEEMANMFGRVRNEEAESEDLKGMTPAERYFAFFSEVIRPSKSPFREIYRACENAGV